MLYRKNIYAWEQWLRVLIGVLTVAGGFWLLGWPWNLLVAASGAGLAVTGVFGWCPACAMVGRRLDRKP